MIDCSGCKYQRIIESPNTDLIGPIAMIRCRKLNITFPVSQAPENGECICRDDKYGQPNEFR
jgi:hypothetical protein